MDEVCPCSGLLERAQEQCEHRAWEQGRDTALLSKVSAGQGALAAERDEDAVSTWALVSARFMGLGFLANHAGGPWPNSVIACSRSLPT